MTSDPPGEVDVLIGGAGPAGLSAACRLTAAGVHVMLVDARLRIGSPLRCAEMARTCFFDHIGVKPRREWLRWTLRKTKGNPVLNRPRLEHDLAVLVAERGAVVLPATSVVAVGEYDGTGRSVTLVQKQALAEGPSRRCGPTDRNQRSQGPRRGKGLLSLPNSRQFTVHARCVIAADGVSSAIARSAGFDTGLTPEEALSCFAYRLTGIRLANPHSIRFDAIKQLHPSYSWVIPTGNDQANVGLALLAGMGRQVKSFLGARLADNAATRESRPTEIITGVLPVCPPLEKPYADGLLVVGAAARLVDPVTGEGIHQAASSGAAAAETLLETPQGCMKAENLAVYRSRIDPLCRELRKQHETIGHPGGVRGTDTETTGTAQPHNIDVRAEVHDACLGCTGCVAICPQQAISVAPGGIWIDQSLCTGCGDCQRVCAVQGVVLS